MSESPIKLTVKDGFFVLQEGVIELYVYQDYFEKNTAKISGTSCTSFGLLPMAYFKKRDEEKPIWVGTQMIPTMAEFYPSSTETGVKKTLHPDCDQTDYTIFRFEAGDKITPTGIIKNLDNVVLFTEMMLSGRIDCAIPYTRLTEAWVKNMLWNDVNLSVPITNIESIVGNLCRYKDDLTKPFSWVYGKDPKKVSEYAYRFINIRGICAAESVFGALSFEDMNYMIDSSLNMTSENKEQRISPIEKVIKL